MLQVCLGYIAANEQPLLNLSLHTMLAHPWVGPVVVLDTSCDSLPRLLHGHRILHFGQALGNGFDHAVSNGGFDEITARNLLLTVMRQEAWKHRCDWLLLCDADEFFTADTERLLREAEQAGKQSVMLECWHACSLTEHVPQRWRHESGVALHDPHPRAIRTDSRYHFLSRPPENATNHTIHCVMELPWEDALTKRSHCHVHVRHMFKTPPERECEPLPVPIPWPEIYLSAWDNGWSARDGYSKHYPLPFHQRALV